MKMLRFILVCVVVVVVDSNKNCVAVFLCIELVDMTNLQSKMYTQRSQDSSVNCLISLWVVVHF